MDRDSQAAQRLSKQAPELAIPIGESAFALLERDLPVPNKLCDPWAVEGLNLIAGRPKLGKTTFARQKMAAMAAATTFLDSKFDRAWPAVFLCLEEGERLAKAKFTCGNFPEASLAGIQIHYEWPRGAAGVDLLDRYLEVHPEAAYVCIDSLTKFRTVPDVRTPAFMADYEAMSMLHELTKRRPGLVIDVIHHTRKAKSDDPIDDISGTYGLTAAVDSYLVMRHHEDGAVIHAGGRLWDRETSEYKLRRANQRWEMVGEHNGLTSEQELILDAVRRASDGLSGIALAKDLGITKQSAWQRLDALVDKGVAIKKVGRVYAKT